MTQEDIELLFKDLCGRLPYGVYAETVNELEETHINKICSENINLVTSGWFKECKPYLRPMDSMTKEEKEELLVSYVGNDGIKYFQVLPDGSIDKIDAITQSLNNFNNHWINFDRDTVILHFDWLNAHHFDYRGLIEKGLALEAPDGMYKEE